MRSRAAFLVVLVCSLLLNSPLFAQSGKGTISGIVKDSGNSALLGALVDLLPLGRKVVIDDHGQFRITDVPAGEYTLSVSYVGLAVSNTPVTVQAGQEATANPVLQVASQNDQVVVTAERLQGEAEAINIERTSDIIVLNSECKDVGGCEAGSPQEKWLRADLAAHPAACTLASWHKPLFSSGGAHGNDLTVKPLWQALYDANADVVINGHDHDYERFAPQTPDGGADPARGIREFVVGTGGKNHRPFAEPKPNSELRDATAFGVLKLTLKPVAYNWQFIPESGKTFTDSGSGTCH